MDLKDSPDEAEFRARRGHGYRTRATAAAGPNPHASRTSSTTGARWQRLLFDAGYAGLSWPKEYGGGGADAKLRAIFNEELDRAGAPERLNIIGEDFAGPTIIEFGTPDQQQRYLQPILTGDQIWCQLFSEPESGSDLASLRTTATKVDGGWRIQRPEDLDQPRPARRARDPAGPHRRRTAPPRHHATSSSTWTAPGVEVRPLAHMLGEAEFNEVFLDEVFIPDDDVVGEVDGGWRVAMGTLAFERVAIATGRVNTTGAVNDLIRQIAGRTTDDGTPAGRRPAGPATDRRPVRAGAHALPDRPAGHHRRGRRRTAGPGDLDRQAVLLPAGRGHRRFRVGAR